jgi:hypothetical protein
MADEKNKPEIPPFAPAVKGVGAVVIEVIGDAVKVTTKTPGVRVVQK